MRHNRLGHNGFGCIGLGRDGLGRNGLGRNGPDRNWVGWNRLHFGDVCPLHFLHKRMRCCLDMTHRFAELASQLGQLFGAEQQQGKQENNGGIGRTEHRYEAISAGRCG